MTASPYPGGAGAPVRHGLRRLVGGGAVALWVWLLAVAVRRRVVSRVEVSGVSMLPELAPGDRLLVARLPRLEVGDLVAIRDPDEPGRILVKRVAVLHAETVEILGDNAGASRDSRQFGPVSRRGVVGRVLLRYHPEAQRRAFLRSRRAVAIPGAGTILEDPVE